MTAKSPLKGAYVLFVLTLIGLSIYSYSQIDLNLTLSSVSVYQSVQRQLILLGYYHRPVSALIYVAFLVLLFLTELHFFKMARRGDLGPHGVWKLSLVSSLLLVVSYPAFSHDLFNYIFDARILVTHKLSPWQFTALDFPDDLWTRFMHWTHRTYPYGPVWLLITIPLYAAGLGKFTLTLFWFKILAVISYLTSVKCIQNLLKAVDSKHVAQGMVLFALNPLVLIEALVSAHIDITMTAFLLVALLFASKRKRLAGSLIFLAASAGIKYVTAAALPVWIWWRGKPERFLAALSALLLCLSAATAGAMVLKEPLPWYFIPVLAVIALLPTKKTLQTLSVALSFGLLLRYAPYLYAGDYSEWVRSVREILTWSALLPVAVLWGLRRMKLKKRISG